MGSVRQCLAEYFLGSGIEEELREEGRFYGNHQFSGYMFVEDIRSVGKSIKANRAVHYASDIFSLVGTGLLISSVFVERSWQVACLGTALTVFSEAGRNLVQRHYDRYHKYVFGEERNKILNIGKMQILNGSE